MARVSVVYVLNMAAAVLFVVVAGSFLLFGWPGPGEPTPRGPFGKGLSLELRTVHETGSDHSAVVLAVTNESQDEDAWPNALRRAEYVGVVDFLQPGPEAPVFYGWEDLPQDPVPPGQTRVMPLRLGRIKGEYAADKDYRTAVRNGRLSAAFIVAPGDMFPRHVKDAEAVLHSKPIQIDPKALGWLQALP